MEYRGTIRSKESNRGSRWFFARRRGLVHLTAKIVDKKGALVPTANNLVSFVVNGPGVVAAVDNGDNSSHEKFQASQRRAYQGLSFAMIKANASRGRITITSSSPGLANASVTLTAVAR